MLQNCKAKKFSYSVRELPILRPASSRNISTVPILKLTAESFRCSLWVFLTSIISWPCTVRAFCSDLIRKNASGSFPVNSCGGRFQTDAFTKAYTAIVDYAHTPDALTNVLNAIHEVLNNKGHIITVVGCGGNRDRTKRPLMAREAVNLSDKVVFTSDNPRFEEPADILQDMLDGLTQEQREGALTITERREAIKTACLLAQPGDVILIAGKGHEDYQEVKGVKHHFDDREEVQKIFDAQRQA